MAFVPRARRHLGRDRERLRAGRVGIIVGKVVDHLLDAHRVARRPLSIAEETAHIAVGGAVDVNGKRRERIVSDGEKFVLDDPSVLLGVEVGVEAVHREFVNAAVADDATNHAANHATGNTAFNAALDFRRLHRPGCD